MESSNSTTKSSNQYLYSYIRVFPGLLAILGLGHDELDSDGFRHSRINPKVGLQWAPNDRIGVRFASFRTLKRELVTDQTIEPTTIAGFNQFFDDFNGTRTKRLGLGIDFHAGKRWSSGFEISRRNLDVPAFSGSGVVEFHSQQEEIASAYAHWIPSSSLTVTANYRQDRFKQDSESTTGSPLWLRTDVLPIAVRYFARNGFFSSLRTTFVRQRVERMNGSVFPSGTERFVVADAIIGYRFPRQQGIVSLEVNNLFDRTFVFQDDNFRTSEARVARFTPSRSVFARLSLTF